jgi:hypothetical protein
MHRPVLWRQGEEQARQVPAGEFSRGQAVRDTFASLPEL